MPVRTRNEFLDDGESSEDDGYRSQEEERYTKGRVELADGAAKRRKISEDNDSENGSQSEAEETRISTKLRLETTEEISDTDIIEPDERFAAANDKDTISALKSAERAEKAARKSGVLYISRVPPFMKPHTLKHLLTAHAPKGLGRIFLTPEDRSSYLSRKKSGGNKKKSFTDGWIEFASKTEAKIAAETLNGNIIGGKKGGYYHDDLWNIKYLSGFKWSHLTDQVAAENAEREARMREEIRKTRKENKAFLEDYERGKIQETMEKRKQANGMDKGKAKKARPREFQQAKARHASDREAKTDDATVKRTLSMIL